MYKLFFVNNKKKSYITGLWQSQGKVYFDNVHVRHYRDKKDLQADTDKLFLQGEKAIFYILQRGIYPDYDFTGYITNRQGNTKELCNRLFLRRKKLSAREIKSLLSEYNGLTVYRHDKCFYIEVYY